MFTFWGFFKSFQKLVFWRIPLRGLKKVFLRSFMGRDGKVPFWAWKELMARASLVRRTHSQDLSHARFTAAAVLVCTRAFRCTRGDGE